MAGHVQANGAGESPDIQWYAGMFGGWSHRKDISASESRPLFDFAATVDIGEGAFAGLVFGARLDRWLRAEAEVSGHWHDIGGEASLIATGLPIPPISVTLVGALDAYFALANLWLDIPTDMAIKPYLGGGIGRGWIDGSIDTAQGLPIVDDSNATLAYQIGAGLSFEIAPRVTAQIGYRYKSIRPMELDITTLLGSAEIESHYRAHNILFGLQFGL